VAQHDAPLQRDPAAARQGPGPMRLSLKRGTGCQAYDAGVREDTLVSGPATAHWAGAAGSPLIRGQPPLEALDLLDRRGIDPA
jgi:hypothetical protein